MQLGVFIPIGNNGWLISTTSPQYKPSFDLNKTIVDKAEGFGFDFALSMIKLHGFGGPSQFWDYNLESFTLMAGLAATTSAIMLSACTKCPCFVSASTCCTVGSAHASDANRTRTRPTIDFFMVSSGDDG